MKKQTKTFIQGLLNIIKIFILGSGWFIGFYLGYAGFSIWWVFLLIIIGLALLVSIEELENEFE